MNKKELVRYGLATVAGIRCLPHLLLAFWGNRAPLIRSDVERWSLVRAGASNRSGTRPPLVLEFLYLMHYLPEFRNLFYARTGFTGKLFSFLCRPMESLIISAGEIGPGLYIQHGVGTVVSARKIGANCWINQQVTVGWGQGSDHPPTLGDNVSLFAGSKVIGNVTVGDNSAVGANAVVVKDVPPNCTVVGIPAYVILRDGVRVIESL